MTRPGRTHLAILACLILAAFGGCTRQQDREAVVEQTDTEFQQTEQRPDSSLTTAVQARLYADDTLRRENVDVWVENAVATLRGTVSSSAVEQQVLSTARSVDGIVRVEDQLSISQERRAERQREDRPVPTFGLDPQSPGWITTKIQAQYFIDPDVKPWNVDVTTTAGGIVELRGEVESADAKAAAVRIARNTEGVSRVDDQLRVRATEAQPGVGVRPDTTAQRTGERTDTTTDPWLTAKIQSKYFLDPDVKAIDIDVTAQNGTVTLRGMVDSERERRQAVAVARNTDGVLQVRDELRVQPDTARQADAEGRARGTTGREVVAGIEDAWITTKIQSKYFLNDDVKGHRVDVDTRNGVVTLTGAVASTTRKQLAEQIARETDGVNRIVNRLTVMPEPDGQAGR